MNGVAHGALSKIARPRITEKRRTGLLSGKIPLLIIEVFAGLIFSA